MKYGKILYMNRHEIRERLVFSVYQHLLLKKDMNSAVVDSFNVESALELDEYVLNVAKTIEENETAFIEMIGTHLKRWNFNRLNYIDQAILLVGAAELKLATNDKAIIIDEAINLAKKYSDDDAYKYINGVLDQL